MLTRLSIRNIVLITECEIAFQPGLSVFTGETGAGKSILLDALGLSLGARGDAGMVRHGETQAQVVAEFDIASNRKAAEILEELGVEAEEALTLRRALSSDGKSRAFINDVPVSAASLKRLGETLVEVQGQHDQRGLLDASTHREALDAYGGLSLAKIKETHAAWKAASAALEALEAEIAQTKREEEYLRHIAAELRALKPRPGEEEELADTRGRMMQSEKLFETLNSALAEIGGDAAASMRLRACQRVLMRSPLNADGRFSAVIELLDKAAEAADAAHESLEALGQAAEYNPQKLEAVEERLFALKAAARKYGVDADALAGVKEEAEKKLALIDAREHRLSEAKAVEAAAKKAYAAAAEELSRLREKTGKKLERAMLSELTPLKMGNTRFRVAVSALPEAQWSAKGADYVVFEAATNAGKNADAPFSPLVRIASGGELSRFLLALNVAMRATNATPTLIFDEIDTGTGGAVADAIGQRLASLSESAQVMAVTHLPQVAARGGRHFVVSKQEKSGKIETRIAALGAEERREELARMLSGSAVTAEARKAAEKLLEAAA